MAGYVLLAKAGDEGLRQKLSIIGGLSTTAGKCFSLKISNRAAGNTTSKVTVERPAKNNKNGRGI